MRRNRALAPSALDVRDPGDPEARPSKTALKQQSHDLQQLGQELAELPAHRRAQLDLPEGLRDALEEWLRIRNFEGRRRQLQYIGKLMRQVDVAPLREAVAEFRLGGAREALQLHEAERWREELLASDDALTRWMQDHPDTDAQALRSLVRAARKDAAPGPDGERRHGRAYREIFQLIKAAQAAARQAEQGNAAQEEADDHGY
ncbi:ribosome biogenesis factor YjgA [Ideonella livida]|uniref:Dual-action ribosomal maturation protein DarP n=1 Tax=Ideonella livida TaxID=2707176 RepID=A0A7C9PGB2_9BURK|nr:ribosome biogenesis factor YjgA [Ideonella livida]NDY90811.1 DUF615 domain-containing protein [Ideonella livida]